MKIVSNRFAILCAAFGLASFFSFSAQAQLTTISDSTGDINADISTAGGTLDIVKMEVGDTATDVIFRITVNGNTSSTDWGKFMIGIANGKGGATGGTKSGNGWSRPINLDAGTSGGMTHWIGSWVDGGNGAHFFTYSGTAWTETAATYNLNFPFPGFSVVAGAQSVITYTVPKTSLGVVNGDTIRFDAYSSGGGTPDSAVDALANPNTSITAWGDPYTSSAATGLASYTLANTLLNTTQTISFSVDMSHQIFLGTFNPTTDQVSVDWGTGFPQANVQYLTDGDSDGIYTGSATISAPVASAVPYRFTIEPVEPALLVSETVSRSFSMPNAATTVSSSYFNNIEGYRDVTFSVNMSVQEALGNFNPATQTVEVRGPFNDWAGTALTAQGEGVYSGTVRISGAVGPKDYKFFAGSYEGISGNRSFTLAFNSDRAPTPSQVLDTVFYSNVNTVPASRPVTFAVDMSIQQAMGKFDPATGVVQLRGIGDFSATDKVLSREGDTSIFKGTFAVAGDAGTSVTYKFFSTGVTESGFEIINPDDLYENRSLTLLADGTPMVLDSVYFSNQSVVSPSGLSYTPSSASGTVDTALTSLNPTVTGTVTSYAVSPTLPAGLSISTSTGVISGTPTAVSASAIYTVTAANGTGSTTATVTIEVAAAPVGSTFAGAYPGASMTDVAPNGLKYLANYAFGGNETTPATLPVQDTSDPTKLRLVVVFRTDDSTLPLSALGGEATTDLAGGWSASEVSVEDSTDVSPVPPNTVRKVISVDRGSDPKKFLRATVTK
jgi:hypothetical protein